MKLSDQQIATYDTDYMHSGRWEIIEKHLNNTFGQKPFRFLDIGGGNGKFADRVLGIFINSAGVVVDNAEPLIICNKQSDRKEVVLCDAEKVGSVFREESFDIIFFNWVLHHLVERSYQATLCKIHDVLRAAKSLLLNDGLLSIYENCYESYSFQTLPSRLIFFFLSNKFLLPVTNKMGANTSGVGVCYLSKSIWEKVFHDIGFDVLACSNAGEHNLGKIVKLVLTFRKLNYNHFLLKKNKTLKLNGAE
jgi:ubiquinone/menaquinone biosynthesis C-methylase UbiE